MDKLAAMIVTLLMSLPPFHTDNETKEERQDRMEVVATSIANVSRHATCGGIWENTDCKRVFRGTEKQLAVALVTLGFKESGFAKHIHEGKCRPRECDATSYIDPRTRKRVTMFRARSMWQMHYVSTIREEWPDVVGTSSYNTDKAAMAAAKLWGRCYGGNSLSAFRCYAGGIRPRDWGTDRVALYDRLLHTPPRSEMVSMR